MTYPKNPKARWYVELMRRFEALMSTHKVPEDTRSEIKIFLLEVAREQYMAGNRSGIAWMRDQQEARSGA